METLDIVLVTVSLCIIGAIAIYIAFSGKKTKKESGPTTIGSSLTMEDPNAKNNDSASLD